jgi:hypothetical protein
MGGKKRKSIASSVANQRLDLFLKKLDAEELKKVVESIENLTYDTIKGKSTPQLRLVK